ncbi:hypothetical protein CaCOL14_004386 [Colletotrichum acutatum]|uniref:Uncharacterized protein n=1 Tax=Glomerella acutata TaxID=27357 RepID=A0AAD8XJH7_GLOAC|nr:uncharacterized protein BDZ83DRAFT_615621 [Colletotrichum acutatum]KAK1726600.1 hypothetical protein BDZ83DRAFT_615621 [Colletotrichum acutatum]
MHVPWHQHYALVQDCLFCSHPATAAVLEAAEMTSIMLTARQAGGRPQPLSHSIRLHDVMQADRM